jgi:hypothetical protein
MFSPLWFFSANCKSANVNKQGATKKLAYCQLAVPQLYLLNTTVFNNNIQTHVHTSLKCCEHQSIIPLSLPFYNMYTQCTKVLNFPSIPCIKICLPINVINVDLPRGSRACFLNFPRNRNNTRQCLIWKYIDQWIWIYGIEIIIIIIAWIFKFL